jgi:soluble lytic murein transglycosylase-like protein
MRRATILLTGIVICSMALVVQTAAATPPGPLGLREGATLFSQGRLRDAEAVFTHQVTQHPQEAQAWLWLGIVYYYLGEQRLALQMFESAVRLAPRDVSVLLWWGYGLVSAGQMGPAEIAFQRALLAPGPDQVHELALQSLRVVRPVPKLEALKGGPPAAPAWVTAVESYGHLARYYNPRLRAEDAEKIAQALLGYAYRFNVDPRLVVALVVVESGFQPHVVSRAGALGLGQLMPETARALGVDPQDPVQNLYGTIRYLRGNLDRFGYENVHLALAAYNAGRGAVERYEGIPPYDETRWYVHNVTHLYRRLLAL